MSTMKLVREGWKRCQQILLRHSQGCGKILFADDTNCFCNLAGEFYTQLWWEVKRETYRVSVRGKPLGGREDGWVGLRHYCPLLKNGLLWILWKSTWQRMQSLFLWVVIFIPHILLSSPSVQTFPHHLVSGCFFFFKYKSVFTLWPMARALFEY